MNPAARMAVGEQSFNAVIFDLDGVVTDTASIHARAWQRLFDSELPTIAPERAERFSRGDYREYIDGKSREQGIAAFLASRGALERLAGTQAAALIERLGAKKQLLFEAELAKRGVRPISDTINFAKSARAAGLATALATSSRNAVSVARTAGVSDLFDVIVDGNDALALGLSSKPDPALFLEACQRLGVAPGQSILIEDAESGVAAGHAGGFGLVVGLAATLQRKSALRRAGADVAVTSLRETTDLSLASRQDDDPWILRYDGFDRDAEGTREALCTLANGYWGTRGAAEETAADGIHYPGTYLAGVYDTVIRKIGDQLVPDEEMVNAPNWLPLTFKIDDGDWFRADSSELLDFRQELDLRRGLLRRVLSFRDEGGRITSIRSERLLSQATPRLAAMQLTLEAVNWSGPVTIRSGIDGRVTNSNALGHLPRLQRHLAVRKHIELGGESVLLEMETKSSGINISMAARTTVRVGSHSAAPGRQFLSDRRGWAAQEFTVTAERSRPIVVEKIVTVSTSRDRAILSTSEAAAASLSRAGGFDDIRADHERAWHALWQEFAVELRPGGEQALALNVNTFHILQSLAAVDSDLDAGIPARGLHGEGYDGHIFWDELFVYPILTVRRPDLSRALLGYRHRRLGEAKAAAAAIGKAGAMFPWQSGIDGSDVTPRILFNPLTSLWTTDNSYRQRHVGLAIAYSAWQFYESTGNHHFLIDQGAALIIEVARFFAALAEFDPATGRYSIRSVMGPDEFHDGYPGRAGTGVNDNVYTNVMTAWVLRRAIDTVELLAARANKLAWTRLDVRDDEVAMWARIASRLKIIFNRDGTLSQFDGYDDLAPLDLDNYRRRYRSIGRLDLIMNAENDSTNRYQVSKQPDCLMLLYLFSAEELRELLGEMGYRLPAEAIVRTVTRYSATSTYGSTLSNVVHSWIEARRDRTRSWEFLTRALHSDLSDIQGGTTREGIHIAAMAGSIDMLLRCYAGLEMRSDKLWFHPQMPPEIDSLAFAVTYREHSLRVRIAPTRLTIHSTPANAAPITLVVNGQPASLSAGEMRTFTV